MNDAGLVRRGEGIGDLGCRSGAPRRAAACPRVSRSASVSPSRNSMTRKSMPSWWPMSKSAQMCGCESAATALASRSSADVRQDRRSGAAGRTLIATVRFRRVSRAL